MARKKKAQGQMAAANDLDDQVDELATQAEEQQSYEDQAPPAEEPKAPRAEKKRAGKRDWQKDFSEHPKFAKFKGEK